MFFNGCFFQAETPLEALQLASIRKPEPSNGARKTTRAPRRALASENQRDEIIQEICAKFNPQGEPKNHDNAKGSIESKDQQQPETPGGPQRPP